MDRIDELIDMCDRAECPKRYLNCCPMRKAGNDCDNYCPFVEMADIMRDYKRLRPENEQSTES